MKINKIHWVALLFIISLGCTDKKEPAKNYNLKGVSLAYMNFEYPFESGDTYTCELKQQLQFLNYDSITTYLEYDKENAAQIIFNNLKLLNLDLGYQTLVSTPLEEPYIEISKKTNSFYHLNIYKHLLHRHQKYYKNSNEIVLIEFPKSEYRYRLLGYLDMTKLLRFVFEEDSVSQIGFNNYIETKVNTDDKYYMFYLKWKNRKISSISNSNNTTEVDDYYWDINQGTDSLWTNVSEKVIKKMYPQFKGEYILKIVDKIELDYSYELKNKDFFKNIRIIE